MTALRIALLVALALGSSVLSPSQTAPPGPGRESSVASNLRIVSPRNGQKLTVDYVNVQFQITNPAAAANNLPTFQVSLDGGDPVITSVLTHTFTGLAPGEHAVTVQMIDANSLPVSGTQTEVHFIVTAPQPPPARAPGGTAESQTSPQLREVSDTPAPQKQETADPGQNLPSAASGLPLLSVIGFGVLVGGIASALKTR